MKVGIAVCSEFKSIYLNCLCPVFSAVFVFCMFTKLFEESTHACFPSHSETKMNGSSTYFPPSFPFTTSV